jgi:methylated-DNA-[protein]-cysteine S-methyltransferase
MEIFYAYYTSPIGLLEIKTTKDRLLGITCVENERNTPIQNDVAALCIAQLKEYFINPVERFNLPLAFEATTTDFNASVWRALLTIPSGSTCSYQELAVKIGKPKSARAIGNACSKNPFIIVIPCHRVICQDGKLGGYIAGVEAKKHLLSNEAKKRLSI